MSAETIARGSRGRSRALAEVPGAEVRTDIQGLRAVAVLLVLGFHLWPNQIVGGFVGVDVFFVISGFLITQHLLRHPPVRARDFPEFWGRRIRRLLPASLLVIVVTVIAGVLVLPVNQLANLGRDAISSVLYVENWTLAFSAVDYLGATQAPSPLQHYWSLGVEEQFYLLWPFVIALAALLASRLRTATNRTAMVVLGVFAAISFTISIAWTLYDPAFAYFATPTRLWELAAGGLLAASAAVTRLGAANAVVRAVVGWVGIALIGVSAWAITSATPFPGWVALLPVGGSAMVLAARAGGEWWSPGRFLALRPMQFVGDTSYAMYLWHFPVIVLATVVFGGALPFAAKLVIIVVCLVLAQLTRVLVEDPVRRSAWLRSRLVRTYALAALATAIAVAVTFAPQVQVQRMVAQQQAQQQHDDAANAGCAGAAALANADDGCDLRGEGIKPDPAVAIDDRSDAYADGCFSERPFSQVITCHYEDENAPISVALVGNSHAAQWLPALQSLAAEYEFSITTFIASRCAVSEAPQAFDTAAMTQGCLGWGADVVDATIDGGFDLIVVTAASDGDLADVDAADQFDRKVDGYTAPLRDWDRAGVPVVVLRDSPQPLSDIVGCVSLHRADPAACDGPRDAWLPPDPLAVAAEDTGLAEVADLSDLLCDADTCFSVVGGVLVYFDPRHLSETYVDSLTPYLEPAVRGALNPRISG